MGRSDSVLKIIMPRRYFSASSSRRSCASRHSSYSAWSRRPIRTMPSAYIVSMPTKARSCSGKLEMELTPSDHHLRRDKPIKKQLYLRNQKVRAHHRVLIKMPDRVSFLMYSRLNWWQPEVRVLPMPISLKPTEPPLDSFFIKIFFVLVDQRAPENEKQKTCRDDFAFPKTFCREVPRVESQKSEKKVSAPSNYFFTKPTQNKWRKVFAFIIDWRE